MSIAEITPHQARSRAASGAVFIDVRQSYERVSGQAEGALGIDQATLEAHSSTHLPDTNAEIVLICQSGQRSRHTGERLQAAGYRRLYSVAGGTDAWRKAGLPLLRPILSTDEQDFMERYARHLRLPHIGPHGQQRLAEARVLLIGAGGLGSPAAFYLTAAGIGHLRIADHDTVERSNLQRQILHVDAELGVPKAASAARRLSALNPRVQVEAMQVMANSSNIETLLQDVDVAIDGADNFPVRYLLNDACVKMGTPLVYGAVHQFQGQVSVFDAGRQRGQAPCYRCLFPEPPHPEFAPSCSEAGVLGVLPGVIGMLQATEALKLLLDIGKPLRGRVLCFDALAMQFREIRLAPDPTCPVCAPGRPFPGYIDYAAFCRNPLKQPTQRG
ncbi:molybdopterin-synthase adenylyltransferase MoeB [Xylella fastidiosa]|uniref:molybdopterin-synthase adenylyltransferase MoeB n=2 Tax=Xylella fastidiosa TaxID=2371 RepID=UPI0004DCE6B7|nr:molybdopterin-synthase adenylyltransferase MoeB [Xylella fastidiosa]KFA41367.1 molybdopterin biosynthesis protein MoeB [Xylella fastidiosa]MBS9444731.1 molybdopterin-synthase adenylyltransferase MoeB [Xylella fastidiosa subsp. multiplex]MBS9447237.1 molybdopterin-synthase adenylyltransferase MoeB [Xylella fastidiosa subsp. multiplex]MBS9449300.1 molybdopterin-synthase adenylyltransferase MoeB [Xylella fastidiosa subsp. multiplex]MBS9450751.1 molybdopterin-synthase adenylyltransferase MoeB [